MTESLEGPRTFYQVIFTHPEQWKTRPGPFFAYASSAQHYIDSYKNHPSTRGSQVVLTIKPLYFEDERS